MSTTEESGATSRDGELVNGSRAAMHDPPDTRGEHRYRDLQSLVVPQSLDLGDVVRPMMQRLVGETVSVIHRGSVALVVADPNQLDQVLMSIAMNARDAMPNGGRLTIETRAIALDGEDGRARGLEAGAHVELAVTDTGIGIDAQTQARIFDPFFTTNAAGRARGR